MITGLYIVEHVGSFPKNPPNRNRIKKEKKLDFTVSLEPARSRITLARKMKP